MLTNSPREQSPARRRARLHASRQLPHQSGRHPSSSSRLPSTPRQLSQQPAGPTSSPGRLHSTPSQSSSRSLHDVGTPEQDEEEEDIEEDVQEHEETDEHDEVQVQEATAEEEEEGEEPATAEEEEEEEDQEYHSSALQKLSKKWLETQLTHQVSAEATNCFWRIAMDFIPNLVQLRERDNVKRKTPMFVNQRRKLYRDICPAITMKFVYKKKANDTITTVVSDRTPSHLDRSPEYIKLYEEAHIKVIHFIGI